PREWSQRVQSVNYGDDGRVLRSEELRLTNLLDHTPAWLIVPQQLLQFYLQAEFGRGDLAQLKLRKVASFDKPGGRVQLAIYEVTRPSLWAALGAPQARTGEAESSCTADW
ncbi:MAG TPA: hypothetical protein VI195_07890, partial [Steroidobacteraceae bacterium]